MAIAYIMEQNTVVSRESERLLVRKEKKVLHTLHIFKIDQLVLFGNVQLTPAAASFLLKNNVDTVFMTRNGRYIGRLQPPISKNVTLRLAQYQRMSDDRFCTEVARCVVLGKIFNMRSFLQRIKRSRAGVGMEGLVARLRDLMEKSREAENMDAIRGIEGHATSLYFQGFSLGFTGTGIRFRKRVRRPPTDPVNALLSLGYTFLFNTVNAFVNMIGLDPYIGALHSVEYGRPSLALDLMEEWRPVIVDSLVQSIFNLRAITLEDFETAPSDVDEIMNDPVGEDVDHNHPDTEFAGRALPVRLTEDGFRKFITQYERKMTQKIQFHLTGQNLTYRDCIREQIRHFARFLRGEEDQYKPIQLR